MAIDVSSTLQVSGEQLDQRFDNSYSADFTNEGGGNPGVLVVSTGSSQVDFGDLSPTMLWVQNLDSTNAVLVGPESGGALVESLRVPPGMGFVIPIKSGTVWRAAATTGTARVLIAGYEVADPA